MTSDIHQDARWAMIDVISGGHRFRYNAQVFEPVCVHCQLPAQEFRKPENAKCVNADV